MSRFGRVVTAMVTPFDDELRLDLDAASSLAKWLSDNGSDGIVLAGSTGEGSALSDGEKLDLFRAVKDAVSVPVIAATGTNDTAHSVHLTKEAVRVGVDGLLVVTPYYNRPSQVGLVNHFRTIADAASGTPILLYDIPIRTGRKIDTSTIIELANEPNIVGVKDAAGNPAESARWNARTLDDFELYSGDDNQTLGFLAFGGVGVISVSAHWAGMQIGEMIAAFERGDHSAANAMNSRLLDSWMFNSSDAGPNPLPAKAMMRTLGHGVGRCRPPMGPDDPPDLEDRARQVFDALGR
ncbi:MAG: 4-hydroxy-tetrahydrodipicolinate synthase [Actinomycetota bacterium]|nr:4-hydroxy-tetrahydrodipicolinate synthase [Actinomycetota bacterium]